MRHYFDSKDDRFEVHDRESVELPNIGAARAEAMRALGGILVDLAGKESSGRLLISVRGSVGPKPILKALAFFDVSESA